MLINSVIIVLREVLEAALIVSILLAQGQVLSLPRVYFMLQVMVGAILAAVYASNIVAVSALMGGIGQEIVNTVLHGLIVICTMVLIGAIKKPQAKLIIIFAGAGCLATAMVRELAEIIIYINGFASVPSLLSSVLAGSFIGAGIGFSIGVFFYYLIVGMRPINGLRLSLVMLGLICAGMVSQAIQFLMQADLIPSHAPLWDTSAWVSEHSIIGQLLFALVGYEATPTAIQATGYGLALLLAFILAMQKPRCDDVARPKGVK